MEDTFGKIIGALTVLAAVVFDWPHALAGAIYGFFVRRATFGYPLLALVAGVVVIAGLGELIYPLIGRTAAAIWGSFTLGIISSGATAYGLFRYLFSMFDS